MQLKEQGKTPFEEWEKVKLGEVCEITMGQSPKSEFYNADGIGMPFMQGSRTFGRIYPIFDTYTTQASKIANPNDIIMSVRAPVGDLNITPIQMCLGRGLCSLRMKNNNQIFLYYLIKFYKEKLINQENGSVFGSVNRADIENLEILLPTLAEQERIASILSALDDKIEVNNKINKNLEEQAQALFKSWFVDFEPFGGTMPSDWKEGTLGEYSKVKSGVAYKSSDWKTEGVPVIKIKNITNGGLDLNACSFVAENKANSNLDFLVTAGDVLIAMTGATIGKFCLISASDKLITVNQRVGKFFLGENPLLRLPFLWCCLKEKEVIDTIINKGLGSAQPNISSNDIETTQITLVPLRIIEEFNNKLYPFFKLITKNQQENEKLASIRDSLVPKLLSGEIRV